MRDYTAHNEHTGWNKYLLVTLTSTSNTYLSDKLPMRGLIRVHEMRLDGYAQTNKVTFLPVDGNGDPAGAEVAVDDAEFTYDLQGKRPGSRAR